MSGFEPSGSNYNYNANEVNDKKKQMAEKYLICLATNISSGQILRESTRGRVQILLTDKTETLKLGIQLEPILPQGSRKKIPRIVV
jgi:hypothetical protein